MAPLRTPPLPSYCARLLGHLLEAHDAARQLNRDPWQFACQLRTLILQGVTDTALRWLVDQGYAEHRSETTSATHRARHFTSSRSLHFTLASCFVLTHAGVVLARRLLPENALRDAGDSIAGKPMPQWDHDRRVLRVGGALVKHFKVPALNQELIPAAFEEEKWPVRMDDPLPRTPHIDPKRRLRDAIHRLNGGQWTSLIRFHTNGHGTAIYWEL
jgi:hypothetical protein